MSNYSVTGLVATTPRYLINQNGDSILSFRMAVDEPKMTNWFSVTAFHGLAIFGNESIKKGDRIIVIGDLYVRDWDNGERAGTTVEIVANSFGHDLNYGTAVFTRPPVTPTDSETEENN